MSGSRLIYYRDLVRELVARDIKVRYKRSLLGFAWTFANPLLYLVVFYFVFKLSLDIDIPRFGVFAFTGILAWSWFQMSLSQSAAAILANRELIRSPGFRPAILPIVTVTSNLVNFLVSLLVLLVYQVTLGGGVSAQFLLVVPLIVLQFILTLSLAYLIAASNVAFRDVGHLVAVTLQLMFFMTPIFYDASMVPAQYQTIYRLNPMVAIVEAYRAVVLGIGEVNWPHIVAILVIAVVLLVVGQKVFTRLSFRFAEEV